MSLTEAFRLRGANFNLLVLRLLDARPEAVLPALGDQFRRAPGFLRFAPIVIGLADLQADPDAVDFRGLIDGLHALEIVPIGTTGGSPAMRQAAVAAGLPPLRMAGGAETGTAGGSGADGGLPGGIGGTAEGGEVAPAGATSAAIRPVTATPVRAVQSAPPLVVAAAQAPLVVTDPVRSGQRVYAEGRDLIVTATVNPGGEVVADGNIHCYAALRGRAIAGARDDRTARIFALVFDPELVAIAGYYTVREGLGAAPIGRGAQVRLAGEEMRFEPLG